MLYTSCFDIIGPIMVGPSSSHTAGAVAIGRFVYDYLETVPDRAEIVFYDSFAQTHRGHGTDKAIVGGLIGLATDDLRIRDALELAASAGMAIDFRLEEACPYYDHPNTVLITASQKGRITTIGGASLGGGISTIFRINDQPVDIPLNTTYDLQAIREQTGREWAWISPQ